MSKSPVTCHVLDSSIGKPAQGVSVHLQSLNEDNSSFTSLATGETNADGRCSDLLPPQPLPAGTYKIIFKPKEYFERSGRKCFYPWVEIAFDLENPAEHHHIPLLISPYSFTTYRGS
ncbi:5-hydroxyisourate hydrolase [Mycena indigotica]|uniref:5-hydroxyisourate hydrolase n=1 Tax=Mycena indigotica TaxID=2126181 RepID=A0A8H6SYF9_9AGAR|nr:5-hydroxyisourate hydrolase [Mycena indigotica]KAF7307087.1 5-hydroxyisourate hydrolase [Mycena indigotica]